MSTTYRCGTCGLPVGYWMRPKSGGFYWKHHGGGTTAPSCGAAPVVMVETHHPDGWTEYHPLEVAQ